MDRCDVAVIGGGPAGLAAAIAATKEGAKTLLIEREARLGGILKQCIHDGFGLIEFGEKLTGPEYVERFVAEFDGLGIERETLTFVIRIEETPDGRKITYVNRRGVSSVAAKAIVLATGCRERTARQVWIHGTRPAGTFTAGTAQNLVNLQGIMPTKRCVVLGSGDIGLIMARRLTLEGAKVIGVCEAKPAPSGLTRNIVQCLRDFDIPLHLSRTVTRAFGDERLSAVEISDVDEKMNPIPGTERIVECDALILSVGLLPENEIAEKIGVEIDRGTRGPVCDQDLMTSVPGVFSCGNALHVNDLVDYVTEGGRIAGKAAARYAPRRREYIDVKTDSTVQYAVPQKLERGTKKAVFYFRSGQTRGKCALRIRSGDKTLRSKTYLRLRPPEMERLTLDASGFSDDAGIASIEFGIENLG